MAYTFELISSYTFDGTSNTVTFNSLGSYKHIFVYANVRGTENSNYIGTVVNMNGSPSAQRIQVEGGGSSGTSLYTAGAVLNSSNWGYFPSNNTASNVFGAASMLIPDYNLTNNNKRIMVTAGGVGENTTYMDHQGNFFSSSSAITSLTFYTTANFANHSTIYLYGIN